jgi:hypothetical protein
MASDRGTMTRGTGVDQQAPWGEPTAPAGRRMPGAPRERKPALAFLAVLLIAGGALAAGVMVAKSGQRVGAIEITQAIAQGQQIPASAIQEVQISADSGVSYVSWQYQGQVSQYFATTPIPKGTLLNNGMLSKSNSLPNGDAEVGLALKDGQIPDNLQAGETIDVYSTQNATGGSGCPGKPGAELTPGDATVISVSNSASGNNTTDVVVAMSPEAVGPVVCNTANGTAGIAIMPQNGAG